MSKKIILTNYLWQGIDRKGNKIKGQQIAAHSDIIQAELRRQGIQRIKIYKQTTSFFSFKKITPDDVTLFSQQIATLLKADIPLTQTLNVIIHSSKKLLFKNIIEQIKQHIESGHSLTNALEQHPKYFPKLYCHLIAAGELTGNLDIMFTKVANYREKAYQLKAKIKKALVYPCAVIFIAIIVTIALLIFVIPQFAILFTSFGAQLPLATRLVIKVANFLQHDIGLMLSFIILIVVSFVMAKQYVPRFNYIVHRFQLALPFAGSILQKSCIARCTHTLATTLAAGLGLIESLQASANTAGNLIYTQAFTQAQNEILKGHTLHKALQNTKIFPALVLELVAIGEESGTLENMLNKVGDIFTEDVDNKVAHLSTLLEPIIIIVLGIVIGSLVIAMYLPIFELGHVV